jgi:hypothetical protein
MVDLKRATPEYKLDVLPLQPTCSVPVTFVSNKREVENNKYLDYFMKIRK